MHGHIPFIPEVLPIAPPPIAGELISSWLLRVAFANGLTLAQLVQGIEARFAGVLLRGAFVDDRLSPSARFALAKFSNRCSLCRQAITGQENESQSLRSVHLASEASN